MPQDGLAAVFLVVYLGLLILIVASMWTVFTKANKPGWASIIPIFNTYIMLKIGDNSGWYLLLLLIPLVNLFVLAKMNIDIAEKFGKGFGFGLGLTFLPFVFFPILAFGDATYRGAGGSGGASGRQPVA